MSEAGKKGLIIVHTGPGKGKTTAALGLAFRAIGSGLRVLMVQFIKGSWHYGELDTAELLGKDKFEIRPMGKGFVKLGGKVDPEHRQAAEEAWAFAREKLFSKNLLPSMPWRTRCAQCWMPKTGSSRSKHHPSPA